MDYHAITKRCDGMCDSCECPPAQGELLDPAEELAAAKADPNGRELSPAAQALYEAEGAARFAAMHGGRCRPWEWADSSTAPGVALPRADQQEN